MKTTKKIKSLVDKYIKESGLEDVKTQSGEAKEIDKAKLYGSIKEIGANISADITEVRRASVKYAISQLPSDGDEPLQIDLANAFIAGANFQLSLSISKGETIQQFITKHSPTHKY